MFCAFGGNFDCVVARVEVGDVTAVVLLVDDDCANVIQRGKNCATSANGNLHFAIFEPEPLVKALPNGKSAVQKGNVVAKAVAKLTEHVGCQRNFRHEHDAGLALCHQFFDDGKVHFRLATTCYAVQQKLALAVAKNCVHGILLGNNQVVLGLLRLRKAFVGGALYCDLVHFHKALFHKSLQSAVTKLVVEFFAKCCTICVQKSHQIPLLCGIGF